MNMARASVSRRLISLFQDKGVIPTFYIVGRALEINPAVGAAIAALGSDIVCHGWRWIDYAPLSEEEERQHIAMTVDVVRKITGIDPVGWYTGRPSLNTRRLVTEHGGFLFDCDDYNDDLPYFVDVGAKRHLVVPHSFDNNDSRFSRGSRPGDRQPVLRLCQRRRRLAAEGRPEDPAHDDGIAALPAGGASRPHDWAGTLPRQDHGQSRKSGSAAASTSPATG
ncbi:polysaccharide deacetylase family protein [Mesorhizobium atlanticum]